MLEFLDKTFVRWTEFLLDDNAPWTFVAPPCPDDPLFDCCPQVRRLGQEDPALLADLSPAHAFAYSLLRRMAESIAQWAGCWLLPTNCLAIIIFLALAMNSYTGDGGRRRNRRSKSLLLILLWIVPLSLALQLFIQLWLRQKGKAPFASFLSYNKAILQTFSAKPRPPSLLDLLSPSSLHRTLFPDLDGTGSCLEASLCLSWWAVLLFTACLYGSGAMLLEVILVRPIRNLYVKRATRDKEEGTKSPMNPFAEECRKRPMDSCARDFKSSSTDIRGPNPVVQRYVTRGTSCTEDSCSCTEDSDSSWQED